MINSYDLPGYGSVEIIFGDLFDDHRSYPKGYSKSKDGVNKDLDDINRDFEGDSDQTTLSGDINKKRSDWINNIVDETEGLVTCLVPMVPNFLPNKGL